jgi:hypothetical protein
MKVPQSGADLRGSVPVEAAIAASDATGRKMEETGSVSGVKATLFHFVATSPNPSEPAAARAKRWGPRHRRAVESVLFHHPDAAVMVHSNILGADDVAALAEAGYNVSVRPIQLGELTAGTPLEGLEGQERYREWCKGRYWYSHFSDLYRMLLMNRYGGVYLDTDVIVTRPFDGLRNVVGWQVARREKQAT